jgi:hypothetical protein
MKNNFDLKGYMKQNQVGSYQQLNEMWYQDINQALGDFNVIKEETIEEMGGVKTVGDKGKMATPNSRPNLGRHRSSDMLDKMSKKDHDKNTVTGAKAAAYKAPHMKEEESEREKAMYANTDPNITDPINQDDIFAGSEKADWNGKAERMDWEKDLVGKEVGNWKSDIEQQAGSISWTSEKYPNAIIYATPGWEGVDGIAVEVHESEEGFLDEPKLQKVVAAGTDLWKTKEGYLALMAKIFTTLEKMLTPAEEIAEDHGTQINHDFNDDISMDYTEPEHMVQNEGVQDWNHTWEEDIADLLDDGVSKPEILTHFKDILKNADSRMEESIEDEDPFGSIKTGIDKITQGDDEDFIDDDKLDRFYDMGGRQLTKAADALLDDGFSKREIIDYLQNYI